MQYPTIDQTVGNSRLVRLQRIPGKPLIPFLPNLRAITLRAVLKTVLLLI